MLRLGQEHILLIGDEHHEVEAALAQALPLAIVRSVANVFDGIAELSAAHYSAVLAAAQPIERRPEAAVGQLRKLAGGGGRLILFGQPDMEPLSRKMLEFGCDDYLITPPTASELQQMFGSPAMRIAPSSGEDGGIEETHGGAVEETGVAPAAEILGALPLAELFLDALNDHPADSLNACVRKVNTLVAPAVRFHYAAKGQEAPATEPGSVALSHVIRGQDGEETGQIFMQVPAAEDSAELRHFLAQFAQLASKLFCVQQHHAQLKLLAITDPLTGAYNRRWFELFLGKVIKRAQDKRFPVTLLIFDIDNFKKYNDEFGHGMGDEILRETASLMRRCCREHDLVARIGGDEFAVVFWEKGNRRQPKEPVAAATPARPPQEPAQVFERFRRLMATRDFPGLGNSGQGTLTISGGLASYPWDGRDVAELIAAADHKLMFHAKREGKNSIVLVGEDVGEAAKEGSSEGQGERQ